jgi:hypothetical protein
VVEVAVGGGVLFLSVDGCQVGRLDPHATALFSRQSQQHVHCVVEEELLGLELRKRNNDNSASVTISREPTQ